MFLYRYVQLTRTALLHTSKFRLLPRASIGHIQLISQRLTPSLYTQLSGAEGAYIENALVGIFELLNLLANKDFFDYDPVDDLDHSVPALSGGSKVELLEQQAEITNAMLFSVEIVIKMVSPDLLRWYESLGCRYFSFLVYMFSSYQEALCLRVIKMVEIDSSNNMLALLVEHLIWGAGALDSSTGRLALQGDKC